MGVLVREDTERGEVVLRRREVAGRPPVYEIIFNGVFLMASTNAPSARRLAHLSLEPLRGRRALRVLIGGLGIGYTLRSVLDSPEVAHVDVVEVEPLIVEWARTYFAPLNDDALADRRVQIVVGDLAPYLRRATGPYDAIVLDVDNGPTWLVLEENAALYRPPALERMRELLASGGVLAVWASERASDFLAELERVFGWADQTVVHERDERGREVEYFVYRAIPADDSVWRGL
ncbi:MAG: spermine/spermidine synthase [Anaerolineae bacterium]|jgi:spermidine synthase